MLELLSPLAVTPRPLPDAGVRLSECRFPAMAALNAPPGGTAALGHALYVAMPERPACVAMGQARILWTAPESWLVLGAPDLAARAGPTGRVTVLDGARCVIALEGRAAATALSRLVPIDLHPRSFGPGSAAATLAAHIPVLLWADPAGGFRLACYRSFARSLWEAVEAAAAPHGLSVEG
ncbi:MAG: Sarcosine oxidase gamma subunit [Rubritepida sp.]|nr:Sarcosine oxidase gamma subunit [Rubritepida sp.]